MGLLDGRLNAVFGAVFGALFSDGVLHKIATQDTGTGGFAVSTTDYPLKLSLGSLGAAEHAASGIPASAVRLTVLRSGLPVGIDLDDEVTVGGASFRAIKVDTDPAGASFVIVAVPL